MTENGEKIKGSLSLDYIGIGLPKAATSWLQLCLSEHPDICGSSPQEACIFLEEEKIVKRYQESFTHYAGERLRGEFTPYYFFDPAVPMRIHAHAPHVKLIIVLRNPIERLLSQYYFDFSRERTPFKDVESAIKNNTSKYLNTGLYGQYFERWLEIFGRERFKILMYNDIQRNPIACVQDIYRFLGVDDSFVPPSASKKVNITVQNKRLIPGIQRPLLKARRRILQSSFGGVIRVIARKSGLAYTLGKILHWNVRFASLHSSKPVKKKIDRDTEAFLKRYYAADVSRLERLLDCDLSLWR